MNFLYPKYCKDPLYVQEELSDEEFFEGIRGGNPDISACVSKKDFDSAWERYFSLLSDTMESRTFYRIKDTDAIRRYIKDAFTEEEISARLKAAENLTNYIFKLEDAEPFVFSQKEIPWNADMGNTVYNQLKLTYMGYLYELGNAYMVTGNEKYVVFFCNLINDFIASCPVPRGDVFAKECSTWTRLGVALRLTAILNNLAVMFDDKAFDEESKKAIVKHMLQTARYVRKYNADNGNHVIVQMASLVSAAAFFAEFEEASDWLDFANTRIRTELKESVYEDGVQAEGSPNYHLFVLNTLVNLKALSLNGYTGIEDHINLTIHKMFTALRDMCAPDGCLLSLGDTSHTSNAKSRINLAACLYKGEFAFDPGIKPAFGNICKFGVDICNFQASGTIHIPGMSVYDRSGFLSYRNNFTDKADFMFMHAGEGINGHAHADTLSLLLYAKGRNILVDTGVSDYVWTKERKYTISTAAHNTVKVDGEDSFVRMLHWIPMRTAPCKIWVCEETDDYVLFFASHYGYHRFPDPVVHTRKVLYIKEDGYFVVLDLMHAEEEHRYELFFHLPPGEIAYREEDCSIYTKFEYANVLLYPVNSPENDFEVIDTPYYHDANTKLKKPTYKITCESCGNKYFATVIVPFDKELPKIEVRTLSAYREGKELSVFEATVMDITVNGKGKTIAVNNLSIDPREYINHEGNPDSDAHMKGGKNSIAISVQGKSFYDEVKIIGNQEQKRG